ncbi:ribonuclease HII [Clostridium botulinum]|uniref:ribonuclease HII n=1 Tax=Clostridium botulinum TaxID=1491 RepID=UPI0006A6AC42|nr:ribonuclease HII [Clostridium botulinum]APQ97585.1 ribonuclease HII family protein [Clostridium botulinum]AUM88416.1 ribonuclease HII [Clostridium botulinum]KON09968.1 ribonuclease HII [Clostridium botulinum]MBN3363315.1 ribonuclease HII [Clostridium botulinum]MBY6898719.1 ribonuclease HII [Clostridium botulinum]
MNLNNLENIRYNEIKKFSDKIKKEFTFSQKKQAMDIIEKLNKDSRKNVIKLGQALEKFLNKYEEELKRTNNMYNFDRRYGNNYLIAGVDEVGRGPLAGPIVAAAVILDLNVEEMQRIFNIKDSKKLSEKKREELDIIIREKAISYNIALVDNKTIDERGISWSNNEVLKRAVEGLKVKPDLVLSDGYAVKNLNIRNEFIIKGDSKSISIASSSIIAKVYRDNMMKEYSKGLNMYGFNHNAGYGTEEHVQAIKKHGPSKIHRMSFLTNIL